MQWLMTAQKILSWVNWRRWRLFDVLLLWEWIYCHVYASVHLPGRSHRRATCNPRHHHHPPRPHHQGGNIWPSSCAFWADSSLIRLTGSVQQEQETRQRSTGLAAWPGVTGPSWHQSGPHRHRQSVLGTRRRPLTPALSFTWSSPPAHAELHVNQNISCKCCYIVFVASLVIICAVFCSLVINKRSPCKACQDICFSSFPTWNHE